MPKRPTSQNLILAGAGIAVFILAAFGTFHLVRKIEGPSGARFANTELALNMEQAANAQQVAQTQAQLELLHEKLTPQQLDFFETLAGMCSQRLQGASVYPDDPNDAMYGKLLVMTVLKCSDTEIRIPFHVGEDHSRTWVITKTESGLLLKHDHRYPDGTPHSLTNYGGVANDAGTQYRQYFEADQETAEMLPEASTNVWMLEMSPEEGRFTYYLERHGKPRFRAELKR